MTGGRFADLAEFVGEVDGDPIVLPIRGVDYIFPGSPPMLVGLRVRALRKEYEHLAGVRLAWIGAASRAEEEGTPVPDRPDVEATILVEDEVALYRSFIPDETFDAMAAGGLSDAEFARVGETLFAIYMYGRDVGRATWDGTVAALLNPQVASRNRAARRRSARTSSTKSPTTSTSPKPRPGRGGTPSTKRGRSSTASSTPATESTSAASPTPAASDGSESASTPSLQMA